MTNKCLDVSFPREHTASAAVSEELSVTGVKRETVKTPVQQTIISLN